MGQGNYRLSWCTRTISKVCEASEWKQLDTQVWTDKDSRPERWPLKPWKG